MLKKTIILLFIIVPLVGMGQGLKKKNAVLEVEYLTKLEIYDSLFQMTDSMSRSYSKSFKVFEKIDKIYSNKYTNLMNRQRSAIKAYELLMKKDSTVVLPFDRSAIESLNIPSKVLPDELDQVDLKFVNDRPKKDYSIYLEAFSKKEQNGILINRIGEIEKESDELSKILKRQLFLDSILSNANHRALNVIFPFVDSMYNVFGHLENSVRVQIVRADFLRGKNPEREYDLGYLDYPSYTDYNFETYTMEGLLYEPREIPPPPQDIMVYTFVDEPPEFPGGIDDLKAYIDANLKIPDVAKEKGLEGKCYLQFIVSAYGNISNVRVQRGVPNCDECDKEAIRLVKSMPNWIPGKNGGKSVNATFNITVSFKLPGYTRK